MEHKIDQIFHLASLTWGGVEGGGGGAAYDGGGGVEEGGRKGCGEGNREVGGDGRNEDGGMFTGVGRTGRATGGEGGRGMLFTNSWHFMLQQLLSSISSTRSFQSTTLTTTATWLRGH